MYEYDAFNKESYLEDMDDDDIFDAEWCQAEEDSQFEEDFLFPEEETADPKNLEKMQKMKEDYQARKLKLRKLQRMVDERRAIEQEIKLEKMKLWDGALKEKKLDKRKVGDNWDIARKIFSQTTSL